MILITGATGFLGHNLIPILKAHGHQVRALVRPSSTSRAQFLRELGVELAWGDIHDAESVTKAVIGCKSVIHGAGHFRFWGRYEDFFSTNVQGTHNVLEAARRAEVERFVHISTIAVIGNPLSGTVIDENYKCQPVDDYMQSKLDGEALVLRYHKRHDLSAIVLRPGAFYGPWGRYAFNRLFFEDPYRGLSLRVHGGRHRTFPIYVPDLAQVIHNALTRGKAGEIFNVADQSITHNEVNAMISQLLKTTPRWIDIPEPAIVLFSRLWTALSRITRREPYYPLNMAPYVFGDWVVDNSKAIRELNFTPTSFETGAQETIAWYREAGIFKRAKNGKLIIKPNRTGNAIFTESK